MKLGRIRLTPLMFIIVLSLLPMQAFPEFYRYVDKGGIIHFVDDLSKVPTEYHEQLKAYQELYDHLPENERLHRIEADRKEADILQQEQIAREQDALRLEQEAEKNRLEQLASQKVQELSETKIIIRGNHILVPTILGYGNNEIETLLLLDTGATIVSLHQQIAEQLDMKPYKTARAQVAGGKTVPYKLAELSYVKVGPHTMENVMVGIYQYAGPPIEHSGLLGMNFLRNLQYSIDHKKQTIKWMP